MFKVKLKAAAIHGLVSLVIAALAAFLVFVIWFPGQLSTMLKGANLFLLVLGVEICLGPLMSLVIYNTNKPKSELVRDYCIVGLVQVAALLYGLYTVAQSRPVYLVFVKDRIEAVSAVDLQEEDLAAGKAPFNKLTWFGPKQICVAMPTDPKEKSDLLESALAGKDVQLLPKYYRDCKTNEILDKAYSKEQAIAMESVNEQKIAAKLGDIDYQWLPIKTRFGAWTVVYPEGDISKAVYINEDPFF